MGSAKNKTYDTAIADKANSNLARKLQSLVTDPSALAKYLGCSVQAVNQYKQGTAYPKTENLIKIADFYNISVDFLLGITGTQNRDTNVQAVCEYTGLSQDAVIALHNYQEWPEVWGHDFANVINFLMLDATRKPVNSHFQPVLEMMYSFLAYPHDAKATHEVLRNGDIVPISNAGAGDKIPIDGELIENMFLTRMQQALVLLKREWVTPTDKEE